MSVANAELQVRKAVPMPVEVTQSLLQYRLDKVDALESVVLSSGGALGRTSF